MDGHEEHLRFFLLKSLLSEIKNPFELVAKKIKQQKKRIERCGEKKRRVRMSGNFQAITKKLNENKNIVIE